MAQQDKIKVAQQRIAAKWDAVENPSTESDDDNEPKLEGVMNLKTLMVIGAFILVASVLFGGTPDLIDTLRTYLSECK